ncbi:MAG: PAS domain S-box protein [Methanomicrobiales archaeon]
MNMAGYRLVLVLLAFTLAISGAAAAGDTPTVLQLNSYHAGFDWSDSLLEGIRDEFAESGTPVDLRVEYMDAKRISDPGHLENLRRLYAHKYADIPVDLVIASDNQAFEFMDVHGDDLFPGVPVVFCGVNYYTPGMVEGLSNVTGVVEHLGIRETIDLALRLHPETGTVYLVNDRTPTGIANRKAADEVIGRYEGSVSFTFLEWMEAGALQDTLSALPPDSVVLLLSYNRDPAGRYFSYQESARFVSDATDAPVYGIFEPVLGHGVVGGYFAEPDAQGRRAARQAIRILEGIPAGSIPVDMDAGGVYAFDARELDRFGIPQAALPDESEIVTEEAGVTISRELATLTVGGLAALALLAAFLSVLLVQHRRGEAQVQEREEKLQALFQQSFDLILRITPDGEVLYTSPAVTRLLGYGVDESAGVSLFDLISAEQHDLLRQAMECLRAGEPVVGLRVSVPMKDGGMAEVEVNAQPILGKNGQVMEIGAVVRDITERIEWERQREEAYARLERDNEQFAILADHIRNPLQAIMGATHLISEERMQEIIQEQVRRIDHIIKQLDEGWVESRWIRDFLRKHDHHLREGTPPGGGDGDREPESGGSRTDHDH